MLAVNITRSLNGTLDDRGNGNVAACAERWWYIADKTLDSHGDQLLAVANNRVAGVFTIRGWRRDPDADNKVIFDLVPAPEWQFMLGENSPVTWSKSQANPVRTVGALLVTTMAERRPTRIDASKGCSLEVDPDGAAATVRGPGPDVVVTTLGANAARLTTSSLEHNGQS